jgi:glyoxylase-like metal-dependent hydrolase (beta-lactamase superfamily II)
LGDLAAALVTHIHLDHSGAAGHLAAQGVDVYVHPRGARHLIDPTRLLASAARIYGDELESLWGVTLPVPPERVHAVEDGTVLRLAGLLFTAIDTPGHAGHHHAWQVGDAVFTGDVGGVRMPGSRLVAVPAVPPEFDPDAWRRSIAHLREIRPRTLYLTHFGAVDDPLDHWNRLEAELDAVLSFMIDAVTTTPDRDDLVDRYVAWSRARATAAGVGEAERERFEAANPLVISVDGILRWLGRREDARRSAS